MSRAKHSFRQSDLVKALKGAAAAGVDVHHVEIDLNGSRIVVVVGRPERQSLASDVNEWDSVK